MTCASAGSSNPGVVLACADVHQEFRIRRRGSLRKGTVSAVAGVSLEITRGETLAVVGETGSGKSTLARSILGAPPPTRGTVAVCGHELTGSAPSRSLEQARLVQMIFQEPMSALDPQWAVERIVGEPLAIAGTFRGRARRQRIAEMLQRVGLPASRYAARRPTMLSGGEAQRAAIARALIASPELLICDEPVTALDASIQAQIIRLLFDLKQELGLTYLLIAHDLALVRVLADRTATMYLGRLCEVGRTETIFRQPAHPYTTALLSAIPPGLGSNARGVEARRARVRLLGEPPSPLKPPSGCRFRTRCAYAQEICAEVTPPMRSVGPDQQVACHFPLVQPTSALSSAKVADTGGRVQ